MAAEPGVALRYIDRPDRLAGAAALLAGRSAEDIAAALVRVWRSQLPAPEEVIEPGERRSARLKGVMYVSPAAQ